MGRTAGEHIVENPTSENGSHAFTKEGSIRQRPDVKAHDVFFVSEAQKKKYGIQPHEECYWARDPKVWASIEHNDRIEQLSSPVEDGGMDARLVTTPEMDRIHIGAHGDLVLMAIPKDVKGWQQEDIDAESRRYQAQMIQTEEGMEFEHEEGLEKDKIRLKARMRADSEYNAQAGLAGGNSPTAGMSYNEAVAHMKRIGYDVEGRQAMLRAGGHHTTPSAEDFSRIMTGIDQRERMANSKGRTHAMGNSGLGRTTQEKLAARGRS